MTTFGRASDHEQQNRGHISKALTQDPRAHRVEDQWNARPATGEYRAKHRVKVINRSWFTADIGCKVVVAAGDAKYVPSNQSDWELPTAEHAASADVVALDETNEIAGTSGKRSTLAYTVTWTRCTDVDPDETPVPITEDAWPRMTVG